MQHNFPSTRFFLPFFFRFVGIYFSFAVCLKPFLSVWKANEAGESEKKISKMEKSEFGAQSTRTKKKRNLAKLGPMLVPQWYTIRLFVLSVNSGFWALIFDFEFETIFKCVWECVTNGRLNWDITNNTCNSESNGMNASTRAKRRDYFIMQMP